MLRCGTLADVLTWRNRTAATDALLLTLNANAGFLTSSLLVYFIIAFRANEILDRSHLAVTLPTACFSKVLLFVGPHWVVVQLCLTLLQLITVVLHRRGESFRSTLDKLPRQRS